MTKIVVKHHPVSCEFCGKKLSTEEEKRSGFHFLCWAKEQEKQVEKEWNVMRGVLGNLDKSISEATGEARAFPNVENLCHRCGNAHEGECPLGGK